MGGGGSQVTGSHAPSSQLPSSVHWRLNARLTDKRDKQYLNLWVVCNSGGLCMYFFPYLPLRFVGDMIAWLALVFTKCSHFEACLIAAFGLQHSIGYRRRSWTTKLTESLWEGPKTIFEAGESVVCSCEKKKKRRDEDRKWGWVRESEIDEERTHKKDR